MGGPAYINNRYLPRVPPLAGGPAPGGDALLAVADIAALIALDSSTINDGGVVSMRSVLDMWMLDESSPLATDNITVVPASAGGNWVREKIPNTTWQLQPTWYIDAAGNDENTGAAVGAALATHAELMRRVGVGPIGIVMTINIMTDLTEDILVDVEVVPQAGQLIYQGQRTVQYAGSVTAVTAYSPPASQDGQITDAALPVSWTASGLVDQLLVLTSGANAGAAGWVAKDLGGKTARYAPLLNPATFTAVDPALGDTFNVVTLTTITGHWHVSANLTSVIMYDLKVAPPGPSDVSFRVFGGEVFPIFCNFDGQLVSVDDSLLVGYYGCRLRSTSGTLAVRNSEASMSASLLLCSPRAAEGSLLSLSASIGQANPTDNLTVGARADAQGTVTISSDGHYGVFDQAIGFDYGLYVRSGGLGRFDGPLWGTGNSFNYAVIVESSGSVVYSAASPINVQTAIVQDTNIAGLLRPYAAMPVNNLTKLAGIVTT